MHAVKNRPIKLTVFLAASVILAGGTALQAQTCTPENPCVIALARSYRCDIDDVDYYEKRFLRDHFNVGSPSFTDDPVVFAMTQLLTTFGDTVYGDTNDDTICEPAANQQTFNLPDTCIFQQTLYKAEGEGAVDESVRRPFVAGVAPWGCQRICPENGDGPSTTVNYLRCGATSCEFEPELVPQNWMSRPNGEIGDARLSFCQDSVELTFPLTPDAGLPGTNGLQDLLQRNTSEIANWFKEQIFDSGKEDYLIGIVTAPETVYGGHWEFDYSDTMIEGFRDYTMDIFRCQGCNTCGSSINAAWGTNFSTLADIYPPVGPCSPEYLDYCDAWDDYRNQVLAEHFERIAKIFVDANIPADYLFGHDVPNAGSFMDGPVEVPNRNPGLTAYSWGAEYFENMQIVLQVTTIVESGLSRRDSSPTTPARISITSIVL